MFGDLLGAAGKMLEGAAPGQLQTATADHVGGMDTGELLNHLIGMVPDLPDSARTELAQTVLGALGQNGSSESDVQAAGVPTTDAKGGDPAALSSLLEHASGNPASLKDAAVAYITNNPQIVQQYAPALLHGILAKFGA